MYKQNSYVTIQAYWITAITVEKDKSRPPGTSPSYQSIH